MDDGKARYNFISVITKMAGYVVYLMRCFFIVRQPVSFIFDYLAVRTPKNRIVSLRNGLVIHVSDAPEDIVTLFLILAKREYGLIGRDGVILDVGANIGIFSLYACMNGAKRVYAFEPNQQAYDLLTKNVLRNNLSHKIVHRRLAITGEAGRQVKFPVNASPKNKIIVGDVKEDYEVVNTSTLKHVLNENKIDLVDLLKLDCQGMEYEIIEGLDKATADKITSVKMEYHYSNEDKIISLLKGHGLYLTFKRQKSELIGNLWFSRKTRWHGGAGQKIMCRLSARGGPRTFLDDTQSTGYSVGLSDHSACPSYAPVPGRLRLE
ncbi:MAG: FkbM family methyltransferase [Deltaproteobacteria bacterium]|nr:FkbM family methyltransferase [Deltaproteobacteria bacterium]